MKILVTGSNGQLGNEMRLANVRYPQFELILTDKDELDICDGSAVDAFVAANRPDIIVNCAAYTAVDKAEDDEGTAYRINVDAVRHLGQAAVKHGAKLVHVSTDYVFDGNGHVPYTENMPVNPVSAYGRTKLKGEQILQEFDADAMIIRTAWLYSSFGNNFVKTMLRLGSERDVLNVVADQIGTPTYAADLAEVIYQILVYHVWKPGIYHFTNEGVCSWYDFTQMIFRLTGNTSCKVMPINSDAYPVRTKRPHYSVLDKTKIKQTFGFEIPYWLDGLERCLKQLKMNN